MIRMKFAAVAVATLTLSSGVFAADCDPVGGIISVCGLSEPEDIVRLPDGHSLMFGQMGPGGGLSVIDTRDDSVRDLYPSSAPAQLVERWGDAQCQAPVREMRAHGIDLRQRKDGRWQVLAVNHTERESVEFFELQGLGSGDLSLAWRGCVEAPPEGNFNDVSGLPDGGFLVTHMGDKSRAALDLFLSLFGVDSGYVYRWHPEGGFHAVSGTEAPFPNGILLSPDDRYFYLNVYFGNEVRKYELETGQLLGSVPVEKPDNSSWSQDGQLIVASHQVGLFGLLESLDREGKSSSLLPFAVVAVNPDTLETTLVLEHEGEPMGAGTVAVDQAGYWYVGSYASDRMIKIPLQPAP